MLMRGKLPSVPEYFKEFIDSNVDLVANPKQCCPFHEEDTPSFSYDKRTGRWSCFGACHAHGDVIDMHMRKFHLRSREVAEEDLNKRCGIKKSSLQRLDESLAELKQSQEDLSSNKLSEPSDELLLAQLNMFATTPERWIQLDQLMTYYPFDKEKASKLLQSWLGS